MSIPGAPRGDERLPAWLAERLSARRAECVWHNEAGGLTFRLDADSGDGAPPSAARDVRDVRYVKWAPPGCAQRFVAEAERLRWAAGFAVVPRVLDAAADGTWLVTAALPGASAVAAHWLARPERAVRGIGRGLRALHEALPVADCPFDWGVATRLGATTARVAEAAPIDRLVVCHGDACAPNTLLGADGEWVGHVDLGALGVADRWADLAVAALSLAWNYGAGWEPTLLDAYGIEPGPRRQAFYRALWLAT